MITTFIERRFPATSPNMEPSSYLMNIGKIAPRSLRSNSPRICTALRHHSFSSPIHFGWRIGQWLLCGQVALFLAACGSTPSNQAQATSTDAPAIKLVASEDYRIAPTDVLEINVFQETDLKTILRVSTEGTIVFPLIGTVP